MFAFSAAVGSTHAPATITEVIRYLGQLNLMLGVFNLVPAFPLDGGCMLRAALWGGGRDVGWATRVAAASGNSFGILLMVLSVTGVLRGDFVDGMWQFLIGLFLRAAASSGHQQTMAQRLLAGVSVARQFQPRCDAIAISYARL